ncbi:MAG: hypothetical protein A2089_07385 [Elusimicrobia bacterium GWD2_63_28]|nr:MAG: hypothetical protein A2089_07385 [Elusimicrobia bacterium GWD2_63_28]
MKTTTEVRGHGGISAGARAFLAAALILAATGLARASGISFDTRTDGNTSLFSGLDLPEAPAVPPAFEELTEEGPSRIVGGGFAPQGKLSFIVSLQAGRNQHFCGGSLIAKNWVLTAAHCVEKYRADVVKIGLNSLHDMSGVEKFGVTKVIIHPKRARNVYDVALLRIDGESSYQPVSLNIKKVSSPVTFITAGWGRTSSGGDISTRLKMAHLPFVQNSVCSRIYGPLGPSEMCAGTKEPGTSICNGDSGGPLVKNTASGMVLVGVTSRSAGCGDQPERYGIFTDVTAVADWINQTIR